ncbi:MAG: hypothetical protein AAFX99_35335 [Myxococcota bacterium]
MKEAEARRRVEQVYPTCTGWTRLWRRKTPLPGGEGVFYLFGGDLKGVFHAVGIGGDHPPVLWAVPDWTTVRRSKREREITLLRLYIGSLLYQTRDRGEPNAKMLAELDRFKRRLEHNTKVACFERVAFFHVPGYGAAQITFKCTMDHDHARPYTLYRNQEGRGHTDGGGRLKAISDTPSHYFLGLQFFDKLRHPHAPK